MKLDETNFEAIAGKTLETFMEAIDETLGDRLDVDLDNGILTMELPTGAQYVLNKHAPNRQIWMSSPLSGASHYAYDEKTGQWLSIRGGEKLNEVLAGELSSAMGGNVSLVARHM